MYFIVVLIETGNSDLFRGRLQVLAHVLFKPHQDHMSAFE